MSEIFKEAKRKTSLCTVCNHNEVAHMKRSGYRDDMRVTIKSMTQIQCACRECEKEGKTCPDFR